MGGYKALITGAGIRGGLFDFGFKFSAGLEGTNRYDSYDFGRVFLFQGHGRNTH